MANGLSCPFGGSGVDGDEEHSDEGKVSMGMVLIDKHTLHTRRVHKRERGVPGDREHAQGGNQGAAHARRIEICPAPLQEVMGSLVKAMIEEGIDEETAKGVIAKQILKALKRGDRP